MVPIDLGAAKADLADMNLLTIRVLWTGLLLWWRRRHENIERRISEIRTGARRGALS